MNITIRAHQTQLKQEDALRMEKRLHFALGRFSSGINRVRIRLTDSNGPKGGHDKECLIVVTLRKGGEIIVKGKGVNNSLALNLCAARISRAVERKLSQRWRTPVRRKHRETDTETIASPEEIEQSHSTFARNDLMVGGPGYLLFATGKHERERE